MSSRGNAPTLGGGHAATGGRRGSQPRFRGPAGPLSSHTYIQTYLPFRRNRREPGDGPPPSPARALLLDIPTTMGISVAIKGKKQCLWLTLGSTELCGRSCLGDYCKIHLARLWKGSGTKLCLICEKGVVNKFLLCQAHGYANEKVKAWRQKNAAFKREYQRLAAIDVL